MFSKIKHIIIANEVEAFAKIISSVADRGLRNKKIQFENYLGSRALYWENDNKVVITARPFDSVLLKLNKQKFGMNNVLNWYPKKVGASLSSSILSDNKLFSKIKTIIRRNPFVILSPYSFTREFSLLVEELRRSGLSFFVDQEPVGGKYQIPQYLDSKVGFRTEVDVLQKTDKAIFSPKFIICENTIEAKIATVCLYKQGISCVVKASLGEGGWGLLMIRKDDYRSVAEVRSYINGRFAEDSIWESGQIIVEEFIPSENDNTSSPSVEFFLSDKGPKITYVCNQLLDSSGAFVGAAIGKGIISRKIKKDVCAVGMVIAKRYWELDYRGFFDIDFVVSKSNNIFPIEANARRTGGTHIFDLTKKIFGKNWEEKTVALSSDRFNYGKEKLSTKDILKIISPISFPIKGKKKGIVVTIVDSLNPVFGFVIFAPTQGEVLDIHSKLTSYWNKDIVTLL